MIYFEFLFVSVILQSVHNSLKQLDLMCGQISLNRIFQHSSNSVSEWECQCHHCSLFSEFAKMSWNIFSPKSVRKCIIFTFLLKWLSMHPALTNILAFPESLSHDVDHLYSFYSAISWFLVILIIHGKVKQRLALNFKSILGDFKILY